MLILQGVTYTHPNRDLLFSDIQLTVNKHDKIALTGNNGAGKSTLLKIMAGELQPASGTVNASAVPYYLPQLFGQFNGLTIAQALHIDQQLQALQAILSGDTSEQNYTLLNDDWGIEERCNEALAYWQLHGLSLAAPIDTLSGGQKTKVFLAGMMIHQPAIVLLDEPSNHLDAAGRNKLYSYIQHTNQTLVVVSHDRTLLNLMNTVCELSKRGITVYGGNYDFYREQKTLEQDALNEDVRSKEKALRKAKEIERESMERQQKLDARGKRRQEKAGLPTISMKTFKNNAEKSTARMKEVHADKIDAIAQELTHLRQTLPDAGKMRIGFNNTSLHKGKILATATNINFSYNGQPLWSTPLDFQLVSGNRLAIKGQNGSGKTTLIQLLLGTLQPTSGTLERAAVKAIYVDQEYSLVDNTRSVYEQAQQYNTGALQEHEIKNRLSRFLFTREHWNKCCAALSGGEKMRLMLCCLTIDTNAPDIIILDEPTNNLDIQNMEILTGAINEYEGTLLVVSHDAYFLQQINVTQSLELEAAT
ncbi:ribosomal protection-like ABC-F family protein [Deminuibacter soli]|uniref:ABC transporter ATP-binding protein n=1 Tax=Deminuibacter soli TaxID=2291815 RepID=A0A3E1NDX1_9BACT|nr:ABC-F family ATP-binding cassette domain-containing protein [Deminuibacter soli]RFM26156.1 ABC transporter ATP-binding protein [Deminuibacter soli]